MKVRTRCGRFFFMDNNNNKITSLESLSKSMGIKKIFLKQFYSAKKKSQNGSVKTYYRNFTITSNKSHKKRSINTPLPTLTIIQRWIKENILTEVEVSKYAKAYLPSLSIKDNARFHLNQKRVLKLDIHDFFGHISQKKVFLIFKELGYNNYVSYCLSSLVTLDNNSLPQGAVTSPIISNLVMRDFDDWMGELANKNHLKYTRYADDITISGDFNNITISDLQKKIIGKLKGNGFTLNWKKVRSIGQNKQQLVTGITVNRRMNVKRSIRRNIRLETYYYLKNPNYHLRKKFHHPISSVDEIKYIGYLVGKINFIIFINKNNKTSFIEQKKQLIERMKTLKANS